MRRFDGLPHSARAAMVLAMCASTAALAQAPPAPTASATESSAPSVVAPAPAADASAATMAIAAPAREPLYGNPFVSHDFATSPLESRKWMDCSGLWTWVASQCRNLKTAWYQGRPTVYASGYTWHDPGTYTQEKLDELTSNAWGGGYGWAITDDKGDSYSWLAMTFKDSHNKFSTMFGWASMTYFPAQSDYAVGIGYSAFLVSRSDILSYVPFPAALPVGSVKVKGFEVMGTFIPKLNNGINHGNVAYFFARYQF